jgi:hypothetical protein
MARFLRILLLEILRFLLKGPRSVYMLLVYVVVSNGWAQNAVGVSRPRQDPTPGVKPEPQGPKNIEGRNRISALHLGVTIRDAVFVHVYI